MCGRLRALFTLIKRPFTNPGTPTQESKHAGDICGKKDEAVRALIALMRREAFDGLGKRYPDSSTVGVSSCPTRVHGPRVRLYVMHDSNYSTR